MPDSQARPRARRSAASEAPGDVDPPTEPTEHFLPKQRTLPALKTAARDCRGCRLYARATQTVFGEGPATAELMLVGEQPGDVEDRQGEPFVGPAGDVLSRALVAAGVDRQNVYVTNAVKHFNFEPRGKARLHKKPKPGDIRACRPWLDAEVAVVKPRVLVLLGATAAQAVLGASFRVTQERGVPRPSPLAPITLATWHPSNVLRAPDSESRHRMFDELTADLERARLALDEA
jgi:DNA polymerase